MRRKTKVAAAVFGVCAAGLSATAQFVCRPR